MSFMLNLPLKMYTHMDVCLIIKVGSQEIQIEIEMTVYVSALHIPVGKFTKHSRCNIFLQACPPVQSGLLHAHTLSYAMPCAAQFLSHFH
jgi:hypothetical protein